MSVILKVKPEAGGAKAIMIPKSLANAAKLPNNILDFNPQREVSKDIAEWLLKDRRYNRFFEVVAPKPKAKTIALSPSAPALINLNQADEAMLQKAFPFLGKVIAENIVAFAQNAGFKQVEELLEVDGIGQTTYSKIKNQVVI